MLPPAMQEAIAEEMKAKHAHKHRGSQTAEGANEATLQAASRKSLELSGRKSLESGAQLHGGAPGVHAFGIKEAEDGVASSGSGNLGEALVGVCSSNWFQSLCETFCQGEVEYIRTGLLMCGLFQYTIGTTFW